MLLVFAGLRDMRSRYGLKTGLQRKLNLWKNRVFAASTERTLAEDIARLGISAGDAVLVHSAFSKLGYIRGGPATFVHALQQAIGPEGTIMMPAFPFLGSARQYAEAAPVFDLLQTPVAVGALQECFRTMPGTVRSLHPTHSFCAAGKHARALVADHHLSVRPFGKHTPLFRFVELGGKTLLVGVGLKNATPFRVIEDLVSDYPHQVYEPEPVDLRVRDENGSESTVPTYIHSAALAPLRNNNVFFEPLVSRGLITTGKIGLADALCLRSDGFLDLLHELLAAGVTPYAGEPHASP